MSFPRLEEHSLPGPMPRRGSLQPPSWLEKATGSYDGLRQEPSHSIESDGNIFMREGTDSSSTSCIGLVKVPPHHGYGTWIGISLFSVFLSACAPDLYWAKPDAGEGEFEQDLRSCREILINDVHIPRPH